MADIPLIISFLQTRDQCNFPGVTQQVLVAIAGLHTLAIERQICDAAISLDMDVLLSLEIVWRRESEAEYYNFVHFRFHDDLCSCLLCED